MNSKNRTRKVAVHFYISEEEKTLIMQKMKQLNTKNFSAYARKMLIDGYVIKSDYSELRKWTKELSAISRNINQIAKRVNETRNFYATNLEDLKNKYNHVKSLVSEQLFKFLRR